MLGHHGSTVAQNGQTITWALERAFHVFMAPGGHCSFSYTLGKGKIFSRLQSAASLLDATKSYILNRNLKTLKELSMLHTSKGGTVEC